MLEIIFEKILQKVLGNYLEGLDKKNLSLGVLIFKELTHILGLEW